MFANQFSPLSIPNLGLVRFPYIEIAPEDRAILGLDPTASNRDVLRKLAWQGYVARKAKGVFKDTPESEIVERFKTEFATFDKTAVHDYLLLVWDYNRWADQQGIVRGWGRGSVGGSLTCFCLGITKVNPLRHKLNFPRFISEARMKPVVKDGVIYVDGKSAPDIDCDYQYGRRAEVVKYIENKYPGRTCKISTRLELTGKMALKNALKTYADYGDSEAQNVSDYIDSKFGKVQSLHEALEKNKDIKDWLARDPRNRDIYNVAMAIEGLTVAKGQHPSGVFINYSPLDGSIPVEMSKTDDVVTCYDMETVAGLGIKVDILGVRTLDLVADTAKLAGESVDDLDVDCPLIYEYLNTSKAYGGLFQIEDGSTKEAVEKVGPKDIEALSVCLAISRPGALQYLDQYAEYARKGTLKTIHPAIDEVLRPTGNVLVFQEQITQICNEVFGLTMIDADQVRYCIAGDTMFVSKTRGWISIDRLIREGYKDDFFLTLDENGTMEWGEIEEIWSNGNRTVRHVEAQNGLKVRATAHHQMLTQKGWKTVHWLDEKTDWLVGVREVAYDGVDTISSAMALVIAGVLAEGYFPCGETIATFVAHDPEMMRTFTSAYKDVYGHDAPLDASGRVAYLHKSERTLLEKYASCGLSKHKALPDLMMGMTKETTRVFLSFLLACEGGVTTSSRQFEFSSKSEVLIRQVQLLLLRFGIHSNLLEKTVKGYEKEGPYYRLYIAGYFYQQKLREELTGLWPNSKLAQLDSILTPNRREASEGDLIPLDVTQQFFWQYSHLFTTRKRGLSGQFYSQNLSRDVFASMVEDSQDPKWMALCEGEQRYLRIDSLNHHQRGVEVFDFRMKNASRPHIVANGLVVHNCVGKKKKEEMAKWEAPVREGGARRGITETVIKYFWDVCNASADYLFVKAHSVEYSYLTAATVYYKAKYSLFFYLTQLRLAKDEPNSIDYMTSVLKESAAAGIKVLPPDILKSDPDFTIEPDPDTGKPAIRFGLFHIRGISDTTMAKLTSFRRGEFKSKFEVFDAAKAAGVDIRVLTTLIYSGCLNWRGTSRVKLALEAQTYNLLTETQQRKVKQFAAEYDEDIIAILKALPEKKTESGAHVIHPKQIETLRRKYRPYWDMYLSNMNNEEMCAYIMERHYLGFSYSTTLQKVFSNKVEGLLTLEQVQARMTEKKKLVANAPKDEEGKGKKRWEDPRETEFRFVAFVEWTKETVAQKSGAPYLKCILKDDTDTVTAAVYGEENLDACLRFNNAFPAVGDIVLCTGNLSRDGGMVFLSSMLVQPNPVVTKKSDVAAKQEAVAF